jgi:glutamyl-Q tRNA(Asp) synthetase
MRAALAQIGTPRDFTELASDQVVTHQINANHLCDQIGDVVLQRKGSGDIAYHLACVHDDAVQEITHVVRGLDLWDLTPFQVMFQQLMGWSTPVYWHHDLITGADGKRLAKIDKSKALSKYRAEGASPDGIRKLINLPKSSC